jgi:hypothetical protein
MLFKMREKVMRCLNLIRQFSITMAPFTTDQYMKPVKSKDMVITYPSKYSMPKGIRVSLKKQNIQRHDINLAITTFVYEPLKFVLKYL